jgi:hypothetical protein
MDKEECKNFLVTIHNLSPHSIISIKFSSGCDHMFHEEFENSFMNKPAMICREDAHVALISGYNNVTSQHTYIGGYQTCAVLISKNCA